MSAEKLKADAARLAEHLSTKFGYKLKPSAALEALAISRGFRDWNSCLAATLSKHPSPIEIVEQAPSMTLPAEKLRRLGHTHGQAWLAAIANGRPGLYLIAGGAGSGRSTTIRALFDDLSEGDKYSALLLEYAAPGRTLHQVSRDGMQELRGAVQNSANIILAPDEVRERDFAGALLAAADEGRTVVAVVHGTSVHAAYRRILALSGDKERVHQHLAGILVHRRINRDDFCLTSEMVLFTDSAAVRALKDSLPTWPTFLDDAVLKVRQGRVSPYDVIKEFGGVAEARLAEWNLKAEDVRRALAGR